MKSTSFALLSATILIFTGCGSDKVANTTMINTDKTYTSQINSKVYKRDWGVILKLMLILKRRLNKYERQKRY